MFLVIILIMHAKNLLDRRQCIVCVLDDSGVCPAAGGNGHACAYAQAQRAYGGAVALAAFNGLSQLKCSRRGAGRWLHQILVDFVGFIPPQRPAFPLFILGE